MSFNEDIKRKAMVACGRRCCICHKFCGNNMEVHHIKAHADGGEDTFDNAIPLCFDCHAIVRQYDPRHPKGLKFTEKELVMHRDAWYAKIKNNMDNSGSAEKTQSPRIVHQEGYKNIMLHKVNEGKELLVFLSGVYGISYDEEAKNAEEAKVIGEFIQYIQEIIDMDDILEPSDRITLGLDLNDDLNTLDKQGFWVFVGKEYRKLVGGVGNPDPEDFPVVLIRIVRKSSQEIIKKKI